MFPVRHNSPVQFSVHIPASDLPEPRVLSPTVFGRRVRVLVICAQWAAAAAAAAGVDTCAVAMLGWWEYVSSVGSLTLSWNHEAFYLLYSVVLCNVLLKVFMKVESQIMENIQSFFNARSLIF